jgi:elongation factor G
VASKSLDAKEVEMDELSTPWPLIQRVIAVAGNPQDTSSPAAVTIQLRDATGHDYTLRLSSAAAVGLCTLLSTHPRMRQTFRELAGTDRFRVDEFTPAFEIYIEPETHADRTKLVAVLSALATDESQYCFAINDSTGRPEPGVILDVIDEQQLDQIVDAIRRIHDLGIAIGPPHVAYRERITRRAEVDYAHKKQSGGSGEFARVKLVLEPVPDNRGHSFMSTRADSILRADFIDGVERGVRSSMASGVLAGFPVIGVRVLLVDGAQHDVDSRVIAFETAAQAAVREALRQGEPELVEPVMRVEIVTPEEHLPAIIDDLKGRRGLTDGRGRRSRDGIVVTATVPATHLFGYTKSLAAITHGRASCTMQFDHYTGVLLPDDPGFRPAAAARA